MEWISRRTQLVVVALGYAAVFAIAGLLIVQRYFQYLNHPDDVAAYGGMYAGGDLVLEVFICGMLLVMTFFLVLVIRSSEAAYTVYSWVLLCLGLTLPLSAGLLLIPAVNQGSTLLGSVCMFRLFASPMVVVAMVMSRLFAKFPRPKRLTVYGVLIESLTLILLLVSLVLPGHL